MKIKIKNIILYIFFALPFLDSINGYLLRNINISIGPVYHLLFAIIIFLVANITDKHNISGKEQKCFIIFLIFFVLSILINMLDSKSIFDYSRALKCLVTGIYIYSFLLYSRNCPDILLKILDYTSLSIPLILLSLRITSLGYNYYGDGVSGYVGWYSSLDELNVILMILMIYVIMTFKSNKMLPYIKLFSISICMILVTSKASLLMLLLIMFYFILTRIKILFGKGRLYRKSLILIFIIIIIAIGIGKPILEQALELFFSRQTYLYANKSVEGGFMNYFTSGRINKFDDLLGDPLNQLLKANPIMYLFRFFIGNGFMDYKYFGFKEDFHFEMDFFDAYYWLGIPGACLYIILFVYFFKKCIYCQSSSIKYLAFGLMFGVSFAIGHVLFAGVASIYFSLFLAVLSNVNLCKEKENMTLHSNRKVALRHVHSPYIR